MPARRDAKRRSLELAITAFAGSISAEAHPEWATDADVVAWARQIRASWARNPYGHPMPLDSQTARDDR
ncbi:MAG: hypothetical protein HY875_11850 [Chloroflexi bacterium]|nr:hypothetical protein [Chloroflexota bacterium]